MSKLIPNSFQVPNILIDEYLKDLSSNDFVILMVVIRKTLGWRKQHDAISISQFQEITGLSNRVVIQCCKSLVNKELLVVKNGFRNVKIYSFNLCKKVTSDEKSLVTKSTPTYDEKSQEPMTKSHTQKTIKDNKQNPINIKGKKSKFIPPKIEEIQKYSKQQNREDLALKFFNYYEAGDWKDQYGNQVKNWKQKFLTWVSRNQKPKVSVNNIDVDYNEGATC